MRTALGILALVVSLTLPAEAQYLQSDRNDTQQYQPADQQSTIQELRPSSLVPSSATITLEQLYTLINERDRQYQQRFEGQEKAVNAALIAAKEAVNAALASSKEAVTKAETANEKRLDAVNEFRAQLKDQQLTLMPRTEADIRLKTLEAEVARLNTVIIGIISKGEGASWLWGLIVAGIGMVGAILGAVVGFRAMLPARK